MARLYDRLRLQHGFTSAKPQPHDWWDTMADLEKAIVVDATNVMAYWHQQMIVLNDGRLWQRLNLEDFPCIVPPFPDVFIEARLPHWVKYKGPRGGEWPRAQGTLFRTKRIDDSGGRWDQAFWVRGLAFVEYSEGESFLQGETHFYVEADGRPALEDGNARFWRSDYVGPGLSDRFPNDADRQMNDIHNELFPFLLAFSFMHCKNVRRVENVPPAKLDKAYQKRHGRPLVRYYTLEIDPMKELLRREGKSEEVGLRRALHICRGHFADYTEKGLFGKHHGIYWWDAHVRGHASAGAVVKDYAVKAPRQPVQP